MADEQPTVAALALKEYKGFVARPYDMGGGKFVVVYYDPNGGKIHRQEFEGINTTTFFQLKGAEIDRKLEELHAKAKQPDIWVHGQQPPREKK